jgi:hypothetical protein
MLRDNWWLALDSFLKEHNWIDETVIKDPIPNSTISLHRPFKLLNYDELRTYLNLQMSGKFALQRHMAGTSG